MIEVPSKYIFTTALCVHFQGFKYTIKKMGGQLFYTSLTWIFSLNWSMERRLENGSPLNFFFFNSL